MNKPTFEGVPVIKVKPKWLGQLCPNCRGWTTVSNQRLPCKVCGAKGYIEIPVETVEGMRDVQ